MARVEAEPSPDLRQQPGGSVVVKVDPEVARAMGHGHVKPTPGPSTERPVVYEVLTEPQPTTTD